MNLPSRGQSAAGTQPATLGPSVVWHNWVGNQSAEVRHFNMPSCEDELGALVRRAAEDRLRVRVVGGGHSVTPVVPTDGLLLSCARLAGVYTVDPAARTATIGGGTRISALGQPLRAAGLALANQGDIDLQTIAGAVMTGTHGNGIELPCLAAPVRAMRLMTAADEIVELSRERTPDQLAAAQVSLGMLGVVLDLTLDLVPAYDLHERLWQASFDEGIEAAEELARANRHFMFFWCPHEHSGSLFSLPDTVSAGQERRPDMCEMRVMNITDAPPSSVAGRPNERIAPGYEIFPGGQPMPNHHECEYSVPVESAADVMRELRRIILAKHPTCIMPVEYRFVAPDEAWLSPFYRRTAVMISIASPAARDDRYGAFFADAEALFAQVGGRPHWGKIHHKARAGIASVYPRYDQFVQMRRELDPAGVFLNQHLEQLFA